MSQENMEIVRRIYQDGLLAHGRDQILALATPDVEYVNPPEAVDPGVRRGTAEVARAFRNLSESFDSFRHELHELFDAGDSVVASVSFCTRSGGSETEVTQQEAHTWTFQAGRIARFEWGRNLDRALEAAGLSQ